MTSRSGALFVFEGPDGVGKTTLANAACEALAGRLPAPITVLSFPGRQPHTLGELVYGIHHQRQSQGFAGIDPTALQLLHVAAHIDAISREIRPRLESGEIVFLDRYWWSTWVYGVLSGADKHSLRVLIALEKLHWGDLAPETVFLIHRPAELVQASDQEALASRTQEYERLAAEQPNVVGVYNSATIDEAVNEICDVVYQRLAADPVGQMKV